MERNTVYASTSSCLTFLLSNKGIHYSLPVLITSQHTSYMRLQWLDAVVCESSAFIRRIITQLHCEDVVNKQSPKAFLIYLIKKDLLRFHILVVRVIFNFDLS